MKAKVLKLFANGGHEFAEVEMVKRDIPAETLQTAVGGWLEFVWLSGAGVPSEVGMYLNEEGKLLGLPINHLATKFYGCGDCIAGDAVVCGVRGDGCSVGLTAAQEETFRKLLEANKANG